MTLLAYRIRPRWVVAAIIGIFLLVAVFVFFFMPPLVVHAKDFDVPSNRVKAENDVRTTGVQLLGGIALGLGAVFTGITLVYNREQQITERFTRAVEELGHDRTDVRIGGIYALERIMVDSRRDHGPIVDILAAFVREHATDDDRVSGEVQAALTALGRRPVRPAEELDYLRLSRTTLPKAHLREASFRCARLRHAKLDDAHLEGAWLDGARLRGASLREADLEGAHLSFANLAKADLSGAKLAGATLDHATFLKADMTGADFTGASLVHAHLAEARGGPALSEKQRSEVHCLPERSCDEGAKATLPKDHPCARFRWD